MKYFKITLRQNPGSKDLIYPEKYQVEIGNFNKGHLYAEDKPELLLCIEDKNATGIARECVEEITEAEAKAISETNETRKEEITDEAKIRRIELKVKMGNVLTADENKAINPDDPTPGFGKRKILADKIDDLKTEEMKELAK